MYSLHNGIPSILLCTQLLICHLETILFMYNKMPLPRNISVMFFLYWQPQTTEGMTEDFQVKQLMLHFSCPKSLTLQPRQRNPCYSSSLYSFQIGWTDLKVMIFYAFLVALKQRDPSIISLQYFSSAIPDSDVKDVRAHWAGDGHVAQPLACHNDTGDEVGDGGSSC